MAATAPETRPTVRAQARWVRLSARKARVVLEHIRGRTVPEARTVLAFTQRAAAHEIEKVLRSAVANAESRDDLRWDGDDLVIVAAYADEGPTLKRWRARARGRVNRIRKRTCHITIELAQSPAAVAAAAAAAAAAPKRAPRKKVEPVEPEAVVEETAAEETTVEESPVEETDTTDEAETTEEAENTEETDTTEETS